ncbi:MAG: hypothetical protein ACKOD9_14660 [Rubrivivax sp.]
MKSTSWAIGLPGNEFDEASGKGIDAHPPAAASGAGHGAPTAAPAAPAAPAASAEAPASAAYR